MSKPKPIYADDWVTLYRGDCLEVLPQLGTVDHVITDPPFDDRASDGMRTNVGRAQRGDGFRAMQSKSPKPRWTSWGSTSARRLEIVVTGGIRIHTA